MSLVGVVIVQLGEQSTQINLRAKQTATVASGRTLGINMITGLAAVLVMCLTSAFASVYLEATFKKSDADIFVQNIRLSLISLPMAGATVLANFKTIQDSEFLLSLFPVHFFYSRRILYWMEPLGLDRYLRSSFCRNHRECGHPSFGQHQEGILSSKSEFFDNILRRPCLNSR